MLKPENVCPLFPTALKLQEQLLKLQDLVLERIASSKKDHHICIKVMGVKHVNTNTACGNLRAAYPENLCRHNRPSKQAWQYTTGRRNRLGSITADVMDVY